MRVAVLSDIHANRPALEAVLEAIGETGAEELWCLGDLVGYGAQPDGCTELVRERSARLRRLGRKLSLEFRRGFEGRVLDAVALAGSREGRSRALTGNYIDLRLDGPTPRPREIVGVRVLRATPDETVGVLEDPPAWSLARPG